jgi:hypothetical protein
VAKSLTDTVKKHIILVTNREYRTVCGCNPNAPTADLMTDSTCRKCVESVACLLDIGLAEVGRVWLMHKDKTRTLIREELVLISQNAGSDARRAGLPKQTDG